MKRFLCILIFCLFPASLLWADEQTVAPEPESDNLLLVVPLEGPFSIFGQEAKNGAELALKTWGGGFKLIVANESKKDPLNDIPSFAKTKLVIGHLFEPSLSRLGPYYIKNSIPVLLPFLDSLEADKPGAGFFKMLPDQRAQGQKLAMDILGQARKPQKIMIVTREGPEQILAESFEETLKNPPDPEPVDKNQKKPLVLKPLSTKIPILKIMLTPEDDLAIFSVKEKQYPDLILLSVGPMDALRLAPYLADSGYKKAKIVAPVSLAIRDVGAAYLSLGLNLNYCLPVNLANVQDKKLQEFRRIYLNAFNLEPFWSSVMAYDAVTLAIKAASTPDSLSYLSEEGRIHPGLAGNYVFQPGKGPLTMMKLDDKNLSFLP